MKRETISKEDLLKWLNNELHKVSDFKDCQFTSVLPLKDLDEIGCNWSDPFLRCSGIQTKLCSPIANQIAAEARIRFNIIDDEFS